MSELITRSVWQHLTRAARKSRRRGIAAVAYFGKGASKLLPLRPGSRLVVDASEAAVKSGQTCPAELAKLQRRGVRIYSLPCLHAKVFVFDRRAFIGSANVSNRSANGLIEAVVATTDPDAVRAARSFVKDLCLHELGPEAIAALKKLYKPPQIRSGRPRRRGSPRSIVTDNLPKIRIAQLKKEEPPETGPMVRRRREKEQPAPNAGNGERTSWTTFGGRAPAHFLSMMLLFRLLRKAMAERLSALQGTYCI